MKLFTSFLYTLLQFALGILVIGVVLFFAVVIAKNPVLLLLLPLAAVFGLLWSDNYHDGR